MQVRVLGAAAGGGFPQWNCNCTGCKRARGGDPRVRPRTQASLAVSADGIRWLLLNASPDLPAQIAASPALQPGADAPRRHSPISAVVLSGGDIDCIAGLLSLREQQGFTLYAQDFVHGILRENAVFRVLASGLVRLAALPADAAIPVADAGGARIGLSVAAFRIGGKIPLYQETTDDIATLASDSAVIGLAITDDAGRRLIYAPACGAMTDELRARIAGADMLFFDGTLWRDDEMIRAGVGRKTGRRMGHMSMSGADGSIAALDGVPVGRKIFIHINNTNPVLCDDSPEAALVRGAGWDIAYDGMEMTP